MGVSVTADDVHGVLPYRTHVQRFLLAVMSLERLGVRLTNTASSEIDHMRFDLYFDL
jgi:hypothetical protein